MERVTWKTSSSDNIRRAVHGFLRLMGAVACAFLLLACASRSTIPEYAPYTSRTDTVGEHHTVALLGASGMVGGYLVREALARGHTVRALARSPAKLDEFSDRITIVQGDAHDPVVINELLRGSDVVISALGPVKADGHAARFINSTVTGNVLQAMSTLEISRYIIVSGAAVAMPEDDRNLLGWWIRALVQVGLRDTLQDKQAEYELLAASSVHWTLVRCPLIDPQPFHRAAMVSTETPPAFRVRAGELARFVFDETDARQFIRQGPFVGSQRVTP